MLSRFSEQGVAAPADVAEGQAGAPDSERRLDVSEMLGVFDEAVSRQYDHVAVLKEKARRILRLRGSVPYRDKQCPEQKCCGKRA